MKWPGLTWWPQRVFSGALPNVTDVVFLQPLRVAWISNWQTFFSLKRNPWKMGLGQKGTWPTVSFRWYISFQEGNYLHYNHDFSLLKYRSKSILNFKGTPHAFPNKQVVVFLDVLFSSFWILRHKSLINIPHVSVGKYIGPQFRVHFPASHGHVYQRSIRPWIPWSVTPGCF